MASWLSRAFGSAGTGRASQPPPADSETPPDITPPVRQRSEPHTKALEIFLQAVSADEKGDQKRAFVQYQQAAAALLEATKTETSEERRNAMMQQAQQAVQRAEEIKPPAAAPGAGVYLQVSAYK